VYSSRVAEPKKADPWEGRKVSYLRRQSRLNITTGVSGMVGGWCRKSLEVSSVVVAELDGDCCVGCDVVEKKLRRRESG
jgi:hypothetical protein